MKPALEYERGICHISGAVTFKSLDDLSKDLLERATKKEALNLDMNRVSECDSAFVALLMACLQIKKQQKQALSLSGCPEKVVALIDVYGLAGSSIQIDK